MWLKASEPNSKSGKGSKRTSRCFLTLILNCFTTDPCWLLFEYACVSSSLVSTIIVAKVVYVRVGRRYQNKGEVLGLFVLVLSNINIIWEKSLSAPLISILTQYSVWHKVDEQLYLKVKHLKNVFCTVYVESGDVGLTSKFMEMGGRAHFFLSLVGSSSISALIWDSFIPAMRLILSRQTGGVTWTYKHTHTKPRDMSRCRWHLLPHDGILTGLVFRFSFHTDHLHSTSVQRCRNTHLFKTLTS